MTFQTTHTRMYFSDCGPHRDVSTISPGFSVTVTIPSNTSEKPFGNLSGYWSKTASEPSAIGKQLSPNGDWFRQVET